jgi:hypothetical protein
MANTHLVSGESSCFVRADDIRAAKRFDTGKVPDDRILLSHFLGPQCQTGGDDSGKSLRNGSNSEGHSDLEVIYGASENTMVTGIGKVAIIDGPNKNTNDRDNLRQHITKVIQFLLERCLLANLL